MNTRPDRRAAWTAAALGVALTAGVFWPGLMSVDSAVQYAQALASRPLDDVLPPSMTLLWRATNALIAGPGGIFLLLCVAWWSGLAAVVCQFPLRRAVGFCLVLGVGLFPPTLLMLGHVWKDVAMAAALLLAVAAILAHHRDARVRSRWLALFALAVACSLRQNALLAVLPLLAWLCWPQGHERASRLARASTFAVLALALALAPALLAHALRAQPTQAWTVVALWDLAALSLEADRVLIPASITPRGLSVDELRRGYVDYANPPLFDLGKIQVSLYVPYTPAQTSDLQRAWLAAVIEDPSGYLHHRARLSRYLLFGFPSRVPRELVYVPERRLLPGTQLVLPAVDETTPFWRATAAMRTTPLFAGATYLALALLACLAVRREPDLRHRALVRALAASAWANALPLLLISGSAEFRYLTWTALAAVLACALALAGRRVDFG